MRRPVPGSAVAALAVAALAVALGAMPRRPPPARVDARAAHAATAASAGSTIARYTDGVVLELGAVPELAGAPLDQAHLWRWDGADAAFARAPFQIDERIERDRYTLVERGAGEGVDANDELVALVRHLGARAPACAWPAEAADADERWDLRVTDPLDPAAEGWLHLLRSATPAPPVTPLITWDRRAQTLASDDFTLVQGKDFVGLDTLRLYGSPVDVLDRSKVRADIYVHGVIDLPGPLPDPTFVFDEDYTEESREIRQAAGDFVFNPVKQGPVRLVLEVDGGGFAYPGMVDVYAAFGRIKLPTLPREVIELVDKLQLEFRLSLDLAADALPGRYSDPNLPAGVTIDGRHDAVPEKPIGDWRQIDTPLGGLVVVAAKPLALRSMGTYYNDRGRDEPPGTGDNSAYGDNGVFARELDAVEEAANFLGALVFVPPGTAVVGERVKAELDAPLVVEAIRVTRADCAPDTPTAEPTASPRPPTPSPTSPPPREATPTARPPTPRPTATLPAVALPRVDVSR